MLRRILASSRFFIIIAVIGAFLAAIALILYGGITTVNILIEIFAHPTFTIAGAKHLAVESIEVVDLFLLATVLYIVALGLYELFIDEKLPLLPWLVITDLDDLKSKLTGVIVVSLTVTFLAYVVEWDGNTNILDLGIAVGVVLFAVSFLLPRIRGDEVKKPDKLPLE